jgi:nucleotide-binding universal stress UspA family protein
MRFIMTNSETIANSAPNEGLHLATSDAHFARIMVATDFSAPAAMALKMANAIGEIFDSEILLVHAVEPFVYATGDGPIMPEMINAALDDAKEEMKQLVASDERLNGLRVKAVVACSNAIELIEQIASEHKVNLIVAGSNGASGLERLLLGSVAETILRKGACPVLIAGPRCRSEQYPLRSILFATDLETTGLRAAQYASALAERVNGRITLLHVIDKHRKIPDIQSEIIEKNRLQQLGSLLPADVDLFCTPKLRLEYGPPAEVIPAVAESESASLIVVGLHHRSALADHAPWSTLSHIVREAKCGVLGVRSHLP